MSYTSSIIISILDGLRGLGNSGVGYGKQAVNMCSNALRRCAVRRTNEFVFIRMLCSEESPDERDYRCIYVRYKFGTIKQERTLMLNAPDTRDVDYSQCISKAW
jgi:hypothetical protein